MRREVISQRSRLHRLWGRRAKTTLCALAAVFAFGVIAGSQAFASSGPMYVASDTTLTEDHYGTIFVGAENVTLDCAGHSVIGDEPGGTLFEGIHVLAPGVTVTNCVVRNFVTGIFTDVNRTRIVANTLTQNNEAIRLQGATDGTVVGNTATDNSWWGILACCNANYNTITGNTAQFNGGPGLGLNGASHNTFTNNTATRNRSGYGIGFESNDNTIEHNVAANNERTGFDFFIANDNTITKNVSVHNGSGPNGGGYAFNNSSHNIVTANIATNNGSTGFNVFFGSELNLFTSNHACRNFFVDGIDGSSGAGNTWTDNYFCNSTLP